MVLVIIVHSCTFSSQTLYCQSRVRVNFLRVAQNKRVIFQTLKQFQNSFRNIFPQGFLTARTTEAIEAFGILLL